jgi:predicted ATPase/DNA-binding CsgD family transcriptional regulator
VAPQFFGRDAELADLASLVVERPLITLLGTGGVGKTRLALELVERVADRFVDGVVTVDFCALTESSLVLPHLARATATYDPSTERNGSSAVLADMVRRLRRRETLIVLDNCEHVDETIARVVREVLAACPTVRLVATSRRPLRVDGEHLFAVGPLVEGAVDLFLSAAHMSGTRLDRDRDEQTIASICRQLDHLPLAIELAAARTRLMPLSELERRLDDALSILVRSGRQGGRHDTMAATIEWSHDRLGPSAKCLFRRLSVFVDGCTPEAVAASCGDPPLTDPPTMVLGELVDASLLVVDHVRGRYRLLEPIRQYAWRRLEEAGERERVVVAHGSYFAMRARELNGRVLRSGMTADDLADLANHRAAIARALDRGDHQTALVAIVQLGWYWVALGAHRECAEWIARAMSGAGTMSPRLELVARSMAAGYLAYGGDARRARRHAERAEALLDTVPDAAAPRYLLSTALECLGRSPLEVLTEAEQTSVASGDVPFAAYARRARARWLVLQWRLDEASEVLAGARVLARDASFGDHLSTQALAIEALRGGGLSNEVVEQVRERPPASTGMAFEGEDRCIVLALADAPRCAAPIVARQADLAARSGFFQRAVVQIHLAGVVRARAGQADLALTLTTSANALCGRAGYTPIPLLGQLGRSWLASATDALGTTASARARRVGAALGLAAALDLAASQMPAPAAGPLSSREAQVVGLVAEALDNHEIAERLHISRRTVDAHLAHIRTKLGISSRTALARWAIDRELSSRSPQSTRGPQVGGRSSASTISS